MERDVSSHNEAAAARAARRNEHHSFAYEQHELHGLVGTGAPTVDKQSIDLGEEERDLIMDTWFGIREGNAFLRT